MKHADTKTFGHIFARVLAWPEWAMPRGSIKRVTLLPSHEKLGVHVLLVGRGLRSGVPLIPRELRRAGSSRIAILAHAPMRMLRCAPDGRTKDACRPFP